MLNLRFNSLDKILAFTRCQMFLISSIFAINKINCFFMIFNSELCENISHFFVGLVYCLSCLFLSLSKELLRNWEKFLSSMKCTERSYMNFCLSESFRAKILEPEVTVGTGKFDN